MFDDENLPKELLKHPELIQSKILKEYTHRQLNYRSDEIVTICDPNNGFVFLLDAFSSVVSQLTKTEDREFEKLYPVRATTIEDLNNAMSDFDYVQLSAGPCELNVRLILDANWILRNAVIVDENYSQLVIPANTKILYGSKYFGIYYPIIIRVNRNNNLISAYYDLSTINPLKSYKTNLLLHDFLFTQDGVDYFSLAFKTYQFTTFNMDVDPNISENTGFTKSYSFNNGYFYAARIFSISPQGTRTELSYTLSQTVYDINNPTVLVSIGENNKTITITIPIIYFQKNLLKNNIEVQLYSTEGYINEPMIVTDMQNMKIVFPTDSTIYSLVFNDVVDRIIVPYQQNVLNGGKSPLDFNALKSNVINGTLNYTAPITSMQLENHVNAIGFVLTKYIDNVTDRIYYAHSVLTDSSGKVTPTVYSPVKLTSSDINKTIDTILSHSGNYVTILPSTLFRYDSINDVSYPLTNLEFDNLYKLSKAELVAELNKNIYTKQPFHVTLNVNSRYPQARTYNLMSPHMTELLFVGENEKCDIQLSVIDIKMEHLNEGIGGYNVYFYVKRSNNLQSADVSNFAIAMCYKQSTTTTFYKMAKYVGLDETTQLDVYSTEIQTSYKIDNDDTIVCNFNTNNKNTVDVAINLTETFQLYTCVLKEEYKNLKNTYSFLSTLSGNITDNYIVLSQQQAKLSFGESLAEQIFNVVDISWSNDVYKSYDNDIPFLHQTDIYQRYNGVLVTNYATTDKTPSLFTLFKKGSEVLSFNDFTISVMAKVKSNSNKIIVDNVSNLLLGMPLTSGYVPLNSIITDIDHSTNTITISKYTTQIVPQGHFIYVNNQMSTVKIIKDQTEANVITVDYNPNIFINYAIVGFGVSSNSFEDTTSTDNTSVNTNYIVDIQIVDNTMKLTLKNDTLYMLKSDSIVSVYNDTSPKVYQYLSTDVYLDSNGSPEIKNTKTNNYKINMIQFDARLFSSEEVNDIAYVKTLPTVISSTSHRLDTVREDMLERTYIYYKPYRNLGSANFLVGNKSTTRMNLALSLALIVYVPIAVFQSTQLKNVMEDTIIDFLSDYFKNQKIISVTDIAKQLSINFGNNVISIDVGGINGDYESQTISVTDIGVSPSISYNLILREDNTLALQPDVTVTFKTLN